ncbi:hypothetical protein BGZ72_000925 [Mortierella alpina]|nr:hypothetical protein BGZ72_000925 [Mortierella alpina]
MKETADPDKRCLICTADVVFDSPAQARSHRLEYHSPSFVVSVKTSSGTERDITVKQIDGAYLCPACQNPYPTKTACRRHIQTTPCVNYDPDPDQVLPAITVPDVPKIPASSLSTAETIPSVRDHDLAVLSACNQLSESDEEKCKTLFIVDALKLRPFAIRSDLGLEQYALAHKTVLDKLVLGEVAVSATDIPRKRRCVEVPVTTVAPGLENLLSASPYASSLLSRTFVELDEPLCELLNEDWRLQPQLQYACAQALAGSIFFNTRNNQAVINNTVEVYGRKVSVDSHRERFSSKKGVVSNSSLPPSSFKTRYTLVWPLTIAGPDGEKLLLGTHSFNALITSSLRLDSRHPASVGGATSSFQLRESQDSAATRIFLDKEAVERAFAIAKDRRASYISVFNKLDQLRQLRSKFHDGSTYRLCRASGFLTLHHTCNPYTVFTLADYDQSQSTEGRAASSLFQKIAGGVLIQGSESTLHLDTVTALRSQCSELGNVGKALDKVISCFSSGQKEIPVIGNTALNAELEGLAQILSSYICTANKTVVDYVHDCLPCN